MHSSPPNSGPDSPTHTALVVHGSTALVDAPVELSGSHVPVLSRSGTGRRIAIGVTLLLVCLAAGFLYRHHENARSAMQLSSETTSLADGPPPVDVVRVSISSPIHSLALPGEARAWYESTIYARVSGYIESWHADIGDKVKKGETLATIDTPELDDQLKAAQAKVVSEKAEVAVAEANEAFAQSTYSRWKDSGKGVVSEQEREEKKAEYLSAVAHLKAAQSQVDLDQSDVNRLTDLTNFKKVEAPYDGVITSRKIDIGDLVTAGSGSGNTLLYGIAQSDKLRVYVDVPQSASLDVKDGTHAEMTADEYPGRAFLGEVTRNSQSIDAVAKTLRVEVDVPNADLALKPGMYLEVAFQTTSAKPPMQIPAGALTFRSGGPEVAVVDKSGVIRFRRIQIAQDMGAVVEIASGISEGDLVRLNVSNQISDGDKVQPIVKDAAADGVKPAGGVADGHHAE